jgi:phosphopentomutase
MLWGRRRNVKSYANGLKDFDNFLPKLINALKDEDVLIAIADYGCGPTYKLHTDHTREYVPLLVCEKKLKRNIDLGIRKTLSDISQTISAIFEISKMKNGHSFKDLISKENIN